ncbi:MAG: hypothetical protein NT154_31500, partial [Verrucomicrobia bacterium]|nr:hypothetical protein [Verrucomicrobiota bacterium]
MLRMRARINCYSPHSSGCKPITFLTFALVAFALAVNGLAAGRSPDLEEGFRSPPESARPWVYWFIMDGNLTR